MDASLQTSSGHIADHYKGTCGNSLIALWDGVPRTFYAQMTSKDC